MGGFVQDCFGGFARVDPPRDNAVTMKFQGVGHLRQAVGADIGVTHITLTADADEFFDVDTVVALSIKTPQETFDILNALYGPDPDTFTLISCDFSMSGRWPSVLEPGPGVTVVPQAGKTLAFTPNWQLVWLVKTSSNTYTLNGDLVPAS